MSFNVMTTTTTTMMLMMIIDSLIDLRSLLCL